MQKSLILSCYMIIQVPFLCLRDHQPSAQVIAHIDLFVLFEIIREKKKIFTFMVLVYLEMKVEIKRVDTKTHGPGHLWGNTATTGRGTHADEHN